MRSLAHALVSPLLVSLALLGCGGSEGDPGPDAANGGTGPDAAAPDASDPDPDAAGPDAAEPDPDPPSAVDYDTEIQPIFDENCTSCHGGSGGLSLGSYDDVMAGGSSGDVIEPCDCESSYLWERVDAGTMPPTGELPAEEVERICVWIDEGAEPAHDPDAC